MAQFSWNSFILHRYEAVEVNVHGNTEAAPTASDAEQAKGLIGSVVVYVRNITDYEGETHVVNTYAELRALLHSARAFRDFSNCAMDSFNSISTGGSRLADAHKAISEDVHPLVCALYQVVKMRNTHNHRVWLSGSIDRRDHEDLLSDSDLGEGSGSHSPAEIPSPFRSASPGATVPSVIPKLEEMANSISSRIDALAKLGLPKVTADTAPPQ